MAKMARRDRIQPSCFQNPLYDFSFFIKKPRNKFGAKILIFYALSVWVHKLLLAQ